MKALEWLKGVALTQNITEVQRQKRGGNTPAQAYLRLENISGRTLQRDRRVRRDSKDKSVPKKHNALHLQRNHQI